MAWSRESPAARGYGAQWRRIREVVLRRDQYCCKCPLCSRPGARVRAATQVDHIIPKAQGGTDALDNLRAVAADCHVRINAEQRGFHHRKRTGPDGWPIDD